VVLTLGEKIRTARLDCRLTQEQLAGREFTKSYVSELERGTRTPRLTTLKVLAKRLNRPLSYFLDGVLEDREPEAFLEIGVAHMHAGALSEAQASFDRALELAAQHDDEMLEIRIELSMTVVERQLGRAGAAWKRVNRCIQALGQTGDRVLLAQAQAILGWLRLDAGDASSALWAFEAALQLVKLLPPDPALLADLHAGLGEAHLQLGRGDESERAFRAALSTAEPYRDPSHVASWHLDRAVVASQSGHFDDATEQAMRALAVYHTMAHKRRLAGIHQALGRAEAASGRWAEAEHHYRSSVALQCAAANWPKAAEILGVMAETVLARTWPDGARAIGETALALLSYDEGHRDRADYLRVRGMLCRLLGKADEARTALDESLRLLEATERDREIGVIRLELALLAIETRDLDAARHQLKMLRDSAPPHHPSGGF